MPLKTKKRQSSDLDHKQIAITAVYHHELVSFALF